MWLIFLSNARVVGPEDWSLLASWTRFPRPICFTPATFEMTPHEALARRLGTGPQKFRSAFLNLPLDFSELIHLFDVTTAAYPATSVAEAFSPMNYHTHSDRCTSNYSLAPILDGDFAMLILTFEYVLAAFYLGKPRSIVEQNVQERLEFLVYVSDIPFL